MLNPPYGKPGVQSFNLQNNLANIKRMEARVASLAKESAQETAEHAFNPAGTLPGGTVIDNAEDNRVQIAFDSRLSKEDHKAMRSAGFVFSRKNEAYQRKRNDAARSAVHRVLGHNPWGEAQTAGINKSFAPAQDQHLRKPSFSEIITG